jgi:3-hydroxybutyryl-CoA dehydrogenase
VNRCARPYYLEALRIVDDGVATVAEVDRACVEHGGFPLGPFELMDLIGVDVSLAVTRSMWLQGFGEPRWRPSPTQTRLVAANRLGRKTGHGFYGPGGGWRTDSGSSSADAQLLVARIVAQLVNEAAFAVSEGVATLEVIDDAMMLGLNHPHGPSGWLAQLGGAKVIDTLDGLWAREHDPRYRIAPLLRRQFRSDTRP